MSLKNVAETTAWRIFLLNFLSFKLACRQIIAQQKFIFIYFSSQFHQLFFSPSSIVMITFIASWLPFFIHYIAKPFLVPNSMWRNEILEEFLVWLGWMNSAMNPAIYASYNNDFRIAFYRLTFRNCYRNQQNNGFKWEEISKRWCSRKTAFISEAAVWWKIFVIFEHGTYRKD